MRWPHSPFSLSTRDRHPAAGVPSWSTRGVHITATIGLVARDAELAAVVAELERTRSGGGRSVLIRGDAGTGKSRLLDELLTYGAGSGFTTVVGRAEDHDRRVAYASLRLALHDRLTSETSPRLVDRAARLDALLFGVDSTDPSETTPGVLDLALRDRHRVGRSPAARPGDRRLAQRRSRDVGGVRVPRSPPGGRTCAARGHRPVAVGAARSRRRRRHRSPADVELDDGRGRRCAARPRSRGVDPVGARRRPVGASPRGGGGRHRRQRVLHGRARPVAARRRRDHVPRRRGRPPSIGAAVRAGVGGDRRAAPCVPPRRDGAGRGQGRRGVRPVDRSTISRSSPRSPVSIDATSRTPSTC